MVYDNLLFKNNAPICADMSEKGALSKLVDSKRSNQQDGNNNAGGEGMTGILKGLFLQISVHLQEMMVMNSK